MKWIHFCLKTSIGKKQTLALTGLGLLGFLFGHLTGNMLMIKDPAAFDAYAEFLTHHPLIVPAEIGLVVLFGAHIVLALTLFFQNWGARPVDYELKRSAGGRTIGSATMPYTGAFILVFLLTHVITFRVLRPEGGSLFDWAIVHFQNVWVVAGFSMYAGFYVVAMALLGLHLSHGLQSVAQTFGLQHPRYTPGVKALGWLLAIGLGVGFGMLPVWGFLYKG